jgi:hypothetical protein
MTEELHAELSPPKVQTVDIGGAIRHSHPELERSIRALTVALKDFMAVTEKIEVKEEPQRTEPAYEYHEMPSRNEWIDTVVELRRILHLQPTEGILVGAKNTRTRLVEAINENGRLLKRLNDSKRMLTLVAEKLVTRADRLTISERFSCPSCDASVHTLSRE